MTICHATGSSTNPYVEITVSANAVKAHRAHQHGEDLIGVPAGGCPGARVAGTAAPRNGVHEHGKVTLCHATGSDTNPFVAITVAMPALAAHTRHQHGEDVVGAGGACPAGAEVAGRIAAKVASGAAVAAGPRARVSAPATGPAAAGDVAGVSDESGAASPDASPEAARAGERRGSSGSLPFTGFGLLVLVALGAASLVAGIRVRRATDRTT